MATSSNGRRSNRDTLLLAAASLLEAAGADLPAAPLMVVCRCGTVSVRQEAAPGDLPAAAGPALTRLPGPWLRVLDVLSGGERLNAREIYLRLNPQAASVKVPAELYARLQDMEEVGLLEQDRAGYRLPRPG